MTRNCHPDSLAIPRAKPNNERSAGSYPLALNVPFDSLRVVGKGSVTTCQVAPDPFDELRANGYFVSSRESNKEVRIFWVYMLRCADRSFYTGHTDALEKRLAQHEQGTFRTCYTFERRPVTLVYCQPFETREEALAMERRIKGWNRAKKVALQERNWPEMIRIARFKYGRKG